MIRIKWWDSTSTCYVADRLFNEIDVDAGDGCVRPRPLGRRYVLHLLAETWNS